MPINILQMETFTRNNLEFYQLSIRNIRLKYMDQTPLTAFNDLIRSHTIFVRDGGVFKDLMLEVELKIKQKYWTLYLEDERGDFDEKNQPLCLFLVLYNLELFTDSRGYFNWCKVHGLNSSSSFWLNYYRDLGRIEQEIRLELKGFTNPVSGVDYELRNGSFLSLIKGE